MLKFRWLYWFSNGVWPKFDPKPTGKASWSYPDLSWPSFSLWRALSAKFRPIVVFVVISCWNLHEQNSTCLNDTEFSVQGARAQRALNNYEINIREINIRYACVYIYIYIYPYKEYTKGPKGPRLGPWAQRSGPRVCTCVFIYIYIYIYIHIYICIYNMWQTFPAISWRKSKAVWHP